MLVFTIVLMYDIVKSNLQKIKSNYCLYRNARKMPEEVRDTLKEALSECGGLSTEKSEAYLHDLDRTHRYQAETWS